MNKTKMELSEIIDESTEEASFSAGEFASNGWSNEHIAEYITGLGIEQAFTIEQFNEALGKFNFNNREKIDLTSILGGIAMTKILNEIDSNNKRAIAVGESNEERVDAVINAYNNPNAVRVSVPRPGQKPSRIVAIDKTISYSLRPSDLIASLDKKGSSIYLPRLYFFDFPLCQDKRLGGIFLEIGNMEGVSSCESLIGINPKIGFGISKFLNADNPCKDYFFNLFDIDMRMLGLFSPEEEKCIDFDFGFMDPETGISYKIAGVNTGSYNLITNGNLNLAKINKDMNFGNKKIKQNFRDRYGNFRDGLKSILEKKDYLNLLILQPKVVENTGYIEAGIYQDTDADDYLKTNVIMGDGVNVKTPKMIIDNNGEIKEKNLMWSQHSITEIIELKRILEKILYFNIDGSNDILDYGKGVYFSETNIRDEVNETLKNLLNSY